MKLLAFILFAAISMSFLADNPGSIYSYEVTDINGKTFKFSDLEGKKMMIVNVASKCGYTPQYEQLEAIYEKYKSRGFVVIGFPANNFMHQEPGTNEEIATFCKSTYGVSFPMMSKISVKGDDMAPIYAFLTKKELNGYQDSEVKWNFQKYLIDAKGRVVAVYGSKTQPDDAAIVSWIEGE